MSIRKVAFVEKEYYHIYNRGNSKQKIFHDTWDYFRFISLLYSCNSKENFRNDLLNQGESPYDIDRGDLLVHIGAYCIMPNHFHILITEIEERGISKFMQKISTAYVMYYNKKYSRSGSLFEGKFKAEHVDKDNYLKYLFSYIHLNPIKLIDKDWKEKGIKNETKAMSYLKTYKYSSYLDFIDKERIQRKILNTESFPNYFQNTTDFNSEVLEWITFKKKI